MMGPIRNDQPRGSRRRFAEIVLVAALLAALAGAVRTLATNGGGPDWGMIGNDAINSRNQPLERTISPENLRSFSTWPWPPSNVMSLVERVSLYHSCQCFVP